jgi:cytochrome c553
MPRWARILAGAAVAGALGGGLIAWSGIIHIGASTGHWKITEVVLHWAMRQSVETHSLGIAVPPLDDEGLVRRGAGHYAAACASCHGAPGLPRSPVPAGMTPEPPPLMQRVHAWQDEELFWIVQHGVKYTGMPAWPSLERADEIWAMVAFLRRLPELTPAEYERLAYGEADARAERARATQSIALHGEQAQATTPAGAGCLRCHGESGAGDAAFPRLAGQSPDYLFASLKAFAEGRRHSGFMRAAAAGLDEAAMRRLAEHYAKAAPAVEPGAAEGATGDAAAGEALARRGDPAAGVPPCASCHGLAEGPRFPHYPRLAGQQAWYLALQLRLLRDGKRGGSPYAPIMHAVAERLHDREIDDLAAFYAGLEREGR